MGYRIGLIGYGRMGSSLYKGWKSAGTFDRVVLVDPKFAQEPREQSHTEDAYTAIKNADFHKLDAVILSVKPQIIQQVCEELKDKIDSNTLIITTVAGVEIDFYKNIFGYKAPVIRAMPNSPAAITEGITGMVASRGVSRQQVDMAHHILASIGHVVLLMEEDMLHAVTALSGSGPAYVFHMMEAMTEAGMQLGLNQPIAAQLAAHTVRGAALLATHNGRGPKELREDVISQGGTTQAGLDVLMDKENGLVSLMTKTIKNAEKRSRELCEQARKAA